MDLLSRTSKMPWYSFGIPPRETCPGRCDLSCYGQRGNYNFTRDHQQWRYRITKLDKFPSMMIARLKFAVADEGPKTPTPFYFRGHDVGDFYHAEYVHKWREICAQFLCSVRFYFSTKSWQVESILPSLVELNALPNTAVRPSAPGYDQPVPTVLGLAAGTRVHSKGKTPDGALPCPVHLFGNRCLKCRRCWNAPLWPLSYPRH